MTSNQVAVIAAPPSAASGVFSNTPALFVFPERTSLTVTNPVLVNITSPGTYTNLVTINAGSSNVFFSEPVDSYYVLRRGAATPVSVTGTIIFDRDVLAIIALSTNLAASHQQFGAPGTTYPPANSAQGYDFPGDRVILSPDRRSVTLTAATPYTFADDLRIITAASILPPIANAGADQSVSPSDLVALDGSASSDPNSLPLTYTWTQFSGVPVTLADASTAHPTFIAPAVPASGAVLGFQLTVSNGNVSRTDTVIINVNSINAPPTANAGTNQIVSENSLVILDGSFSSDPDNNPLTFQWSQVSGPAVILTNANTIHPTFRAPNLVTPQSAAQYQFQLVVNDGQVTSGASLVAVTVINVNDPPVANAGPAQTVNEFTQVTLDGSGSTDPDGNVLTYSWAQTSGTPVSLAGSNTAHPTFIAPQVPGTNASSTLVFRLTASDGLVSSSSATTVRVNNVNNAPIADAGPDQTVLEGTTVTLDGTGSSDLDGDPITFNWVQFSGTNVTLSNTHSPTPSFVAPDVGPSGTSLSFLLIVTDNSGRFGTNTVVINIADLNHAPTVNAGSDQTVNEGDLVTLNGSASDPDANALTINWTQVSGPFVNIVAPNTLTPSFTAPSVTRDEADVVLRLTADDGFGGVTNDDVSIHIANVNHAPVAQPPANMTVPEGTDVTLVGQATDPDTEEQNQLVYVWTQTAGPAVTLSGTGPTVGFTSPLVTQGGDPDARETLTFALVVTDPNGASNTNGVDVVVANVDHSPIAVAGNNMTVDEGSSVSLNGSATSDPDADPLTFSWTQVSGPAVTLQDANTAFPQFTSPFVNAAGATLQFRLTVDDGFGGTNSATVTVTVNNINDAPNISQAQPSIASLWPPNHSMIEVSIVGIIDPNNNATINITSVTQDEPTNGEADATINSNGTALLRADRDGGGNGRVYHVHFTASDFEGSRSGVVKVIVPKSKKSDGAIDGGELYDSTQ